MSSQTLSPSGMLSRIRAALNRTADSDASGTITITPRQIYIIPTRFGLVFTAMLVAMLVGSNNYEINLGFVLTFLLAGTGFSAMLQTWSNLSKLELIAGAPAPVYQGESAEFILHFRNNRTGSRPGLQLYSRGEPVAFDLDDQQFKTITYRISTDKRGVLSPGRWTVYTYFPLGIFYAWAYFETPADCLVYPKPVSRDTRLDELFLPRASIRKANLDSIDFQGHRDYQPGDSPRRVDWKALARDRGMLVKEYFDVRDDELWLEWDDVSSNDPERKLSILCRAVIELSASSTRYGLRLPGQEITPDSGSRHRAQCLASLALFSP